MSDGISVIIPSTGNLGNLSKLVPSIQNQVLINQKLQILIVLNGVAPEDSYISEEIKRRWPSAEVVELQQKGVNLARNAGLESSRFSIVMFLDDDCELQHKTFLQSHVDLHSANPRFFALGGGYLLSDEHGLFDEVYNYIQMNWFVFGQINFGQSIAETRYLLGGNFSLKREFINEYHLKFEPSIKYGGSELAFFSEAAQAGLVLGAIELDVIHNTNESFLSVGRKVFQQGRGKFFIDNKYGKTSGVNSATTGKHLVLRRLYSYFFWAGYYRASGSGYKVLTHILSDLSGYLNALRFRILKRISR